MKAKALDAHEFDGQINGSLLMLTKGIKVDKKKKVEESQDT